MKIEEKGNDLVVTDFNELEAYKIASKVEQDGIEFYEDLVKNIDDRNVMQELKVLIQEERKHLNFFKERLDALRQTIKDGFEEDDVLNYIDYGIFQPYQAGKEETAKRLGGPKKTLRLGIIIEDKSIKFYKACKEKTSSDKTKAELQNIIEEEEKHKALLEEMANKL